MLFFVVVLFVILLWVWWEILRLDPDLFPPPPHTPSTPPNPPPLLSSGERLQDAGLWLLHDCTSHCWGQQQTQPGHLPKPTAATVRCQPWLSGLGRWTSGQGRIQGTPGNHCCRLAQQRATETGRHCSRCTAAEKRGKEVVDSSGRLDEERGVEVGWGCEGPAEERGSEMGWWSRLWK